MTVVTSFSWKRWTVPLSPLVASALCLLFANGRYTVPVCAWLAPVFLLRFTRQGRAFRRLLAAYLLLSTGFLFQFRGMTPFSPAAFWIFSFGFGVTLVMPFTVDRWLASCHSGLVRTLAFPLALVIVEFLTSMGPYGSWGSIAYSQFGELPLLQLLSITGLYGITFLIGWFATVANSLWETRVDIAAIRREVMLFIGILLVTLTFGETRLILFQPQGQSIRVASITRPDLPLFPSAELEKRILAGQEIRPTDQAEIRRRAQSITDSLLTTADKEAQAGAQLIAFGEINLPVLKEDESALLQRGADLASERNIYIALPLGVLNPGHRPAAEDKLVMIDRSGKVLWQFLKAKPVPGAEAKALIANARGLPVADTAIGRLGGAIAFDMDFPNLLLQLGRQHADVVVVPENDWREVDPLHSHMAAFRAIEEGFNLLLHASQGLSIAVDYQGRIHARMDHYQSRDRVLVAQLPTRGVTTLYSRGGFLFPWVCFAALLGLTLYALPDLEAHR